MRGPPSTATFHGWEGRAREMDRAGLANTLKGATGQGSHPARELEGQENG